MNKEMKKGVALNDEQMEMATGGMLFNASGIIGSDPNNPWEVIDNYNGNVLARFNNKDDAVRYVCSNWGNTPLNTLEINWDQLCAMRSR